MLGFFTYLALVAQDNAKVIDDAFICHFMLWGILTEDMIYHIYMWIPYHNAYRVSASGLPEMMFISIYEQRPTEFQCHLLFVEFIFLSKEAIAFKFNNQQ